MKMSAMALPSIRTTGSSTVAEGDAEASGAGASCRRSSSAVVEQVRGGDVDPAGGVAGEQRAGDGDRRDGDEHAEGERDAEVGVERGDGDQRAGVRRDEAVHRRQAGQRRDADLDQRQSGAAGDQEDDRHQQDEADLEEHRQPDQRADQRHRPGQRAGLDRPTIVSTIWSAPPESASSLPNIAPSAISVPTPAAVSPKPLGKLAMVVGDRQPGDGADTREPMVRLRNGCTLNQVISTTIRAMPTSAAVIRRPAGGGGAVGLGEDEIGHDGPSLPLTWMGRSAVVVTAA